MNMPFELDIYPQRLVNRLLELEQATDQAAEHKLLLDLGEALLTHITGIIFGEYKRHWDIDDSLEAELYRNARKKPSFGVFLNLLRRLLKANGESICDKAFSKAQSYPKISEFVFIYDLLKGSVINKGNDSEFSALLGPLKKGRTVARKSVLQFFETFVAVRNTYAHPEEKARNPLRSWPLGDEYYELINPLMKAALHELIANFPALVSHSPALVKELDDKLSKGTFLVETGRNGTQLDLQLSEEDLGFVTTDVRYLLDAENRLTGKFYQTEIPQVNPTIARRIIEQEKAKMMEPVLLDMVRQKLADGVIDDLEYLVLKDTALSAFIPEERLQSLIERVKTEKGIEGDVFVESKTTEHRPMLNPYWLAYFSMLDDSTVEQSDDCLGTTNLHRSLWNEITLYVEYLVRKHLDNEFVQWKVKTNKYQIGRLTYTYWGQIYPENSPFENGFSIGFIVAKKFTWVKVKRNNPLKSLLEQPCIFLYTTLNNKFMEDVDFEQVLQRKYGRINYEMLVRERQALEKMGGFTTALSYRTKDVATFSDYFEQKNDTEEDENLWIYSRVWNASDFIANGAFDPQAASKIEKQIVTYLTLFANSVVAINDYAMSIGMNSEQIKSIRDRTTRNQKRLETEIRESSGEPGVDIKEFAKKRGKELELRPDRIQMVLRKFRT